MTSAWRTGDYIDGCATSTGYALAVVKGLDIVVYAAATPSAIPTETWRRTSTLPISFIRCACNTATDEVRVIGLGVSSTGVKTAQYFTSVNQTSKGTAFGSWPVLLQYTTDWIGYIARTAKTYTRWPFAGVEPAAVANPFTTAGSTLGMIQVIGSTVTWRELTPQTATSVGQPKVTTINSVAYVYPMVVSSVTVGQSLGPPTNTPQILANHNTNQPATIFPMQGDAPHVALLADGTFLITSKTQAVSLPRPVPPGSSGYGGVAWAVGMPPWPAYEPTKQAGPDKLYPPWQNKALGSSVTDQGVFSKPTEQYFETITNRLATPVNIFGVGASSGGAAPAPPVPPLVEVADVVVGTDATGFPNGRVATNSPSITVDVSAANVIQWNVVTGNGAAGLTVIRRTIEETRQPTRPPGSSNQGASTFTLADMLAFGYWSLVTNGDPVTPKLVFDSNGDVISVFVPA